MLIRIFRRIDITIDIQWIKFFFIKFNFQNNNTLLYIVRILLNSLRKRYIDMGRDFYFSRIGSPADLESRTYGS